MAYEEETEYITSYYRCIDPVENFKIRVELKPIKNLYIPLPQFETEKPSDASNYEDNELDSEEYTFKWQEKVFSRDELKKYTSEQDWKKNCSEKYHNVSIQSLHDLKSKTGKLFSYVETDDYSISKKDSNVLMSNKEYSTPLRVKFSELRISSQNMKHFKSIPKRKIINYNPSDEFKASAHSINKNLQRMFIMANLGSKKKDDKDSEREESQEYVLCALSYNLANNVLEVTPSFSKSMSKPYILAIDSQDGRNSYYYWLYHASLDIPMENLNKEIKIMTKVFDYQEELRKLQIDRNFFVGSQNQLHVTILGEITSAQNFEYDPVYIHYFMKLPLNCEYSDADILTGTTQTSYRNSEGICHFSHLFEMNFFMDVKLNEDLLITPPELFFEVLSIDRYNRYRNEGYTYIALPNSSGMYEYKLNCWRALDKSIKSELQRFFIGGGPELEDVSYIGLSSNEKEDVMSRFGFESVPSGQINIKLCILQQSELFKMKKGEQPDLKRYALSGMDASSLLGSVNTVLEAFRKARQRMLEAKKGLDIETNGIFKVNSETQNNVN